tara:strand:- start:319 stop:720 length:402 start_codon:yes stop_codon:yes gene_type:complete
MELIKRRHSVTNLQAHLVFTTKYRRKVFTGKHIEQLRWAFSMACKKLDCEILEMDGEQDHVHLLIAYPPKLAVSVIVNNLKATASRRLRELNPDLKMISKNGALWSRSYFACSVGGAPIEVLKQYIEQQKTPE